MNARHVRPKGQPRQTWAPFDPDLPPAPQVPAYSLSDGERIEVRNQFGTDLWVDLRDAYGVSEAIERLAPRNRTARAVARGARRVLGLALYTASVLAVIAIPPALHGMGV